VNVNNEEIAAKGRSRRRRKLKTERHRPAAGPGQRKLKAERVQRPVRAGQQELAAGSGSGQQKLKAERVQELLSGLPGWGVTPAGGSIGKEWRFPQPRVAAAYAAHVAGLAAAEGQTVHLVLSGAVVSLTLTSRLPGGSREVLTENDFRFAARLG
jgi:pterin-4a-carbinolamine dehydratase